MTDHRARYVGRLNRGLFAALPAALSAPSALPDTVMLPWARWLREQPLAGVLVTLPAEGGDVRQLSAWWREAAGDERLVLVATAGDDAALAANWPDLAAQGAHLPVITGTGAATALGDTAFVVGCDRRGRSSVETEALLGNPAAVGVLTLDPGALDLVQDGLTPVKDRFAALPFLSGLDRSPGDGLAAGANGLISLVAAIAPQAVTRLMRSWFDGHVSDFVALNQQLDRLAQAIWAGDDASLPERVVAALVAQSIIGAAAVPDDVRRRLAHRLAAVGGRN